MFYVKDSRAQPITASDFAKSLDQFVTRANQVELSPGVAVVVVRGDEILFNHGYGVTDVETKRKVTPKTVFYIASSTKSFTGLAAAICAEKKLLDLNAPLSKYLPDARFHSKIENRWCRAKRFLTRS